MIYIENNSDGQQIVDLSGSMLQGDVSLEEGGERHTKHIPIYKKDNL
jgi:hypothetical protein